MSEKILFFDGSPLVLSRSLIHRVGVEEAIVLQQVHYWLQPDFNKNFFEGKHWVRNTYPQWQKQFSFWHVKKIQRLFTALEEQEFLKSVTRFSQWRKVKYYTINYEKLYHAENNSDKERYRAELQDGEALSSFSLSKSLPEEGLYEEEEEGWLEIEEESHTFPTSDNFESSMTPNPGNRSDTFGIIDRTDLSKRWDNSGSTKETNEERDLTAQSIRELKNEEVWSFQLRDKSEQSMIPNLGNRSDSSGVIDHPKSGFSYKLNKRNTDKGIPPPLTPPPFPKIRNEEEEDEEEGKKEKSERDKKEEEEEEFAFQQGDHGVIQAVSQDEKFQSLSSPGLFQKLLDVWNEIVQNSLYGTRACLTPERAQKFRHFVSETDLCDLLAWRNYCLKIKNTPFLTGENKSGFRASLDWALNPSNARKVLEGVYYSKPRTDSTAVPSERLVDAQANSHALKQHCDTHGHDEGWLAVCNILVETLGMPVFQNWFKDMVPQQTADGMLRLKVQSTFLRDHIQETYERTLERAISAAMPTIKRFEIEVGPQSFNSKGHDPPTSQPALPA